MKGIWPKAAATLDSKSEKGRKVCRKRVFFQKIWRKIWTSEWNPAVELWSGRRTTSEEESQKEISKISRLPPGFGGADGSNTERMKASRAVSYEVCHRAYPDMTDTPGGPLSKPLKKQMDAAPPAQQIIQCFRRLNVAQNIVIYPSASMRGWHSKKLKKLNLLRSRKSVESISQI